MPPRPADLARFQESLDRCLATPDFVDRFYARFVSSDEVVAARFRETNLKRQAAMLRASLYLVLRAAQGQPDGREHLLEIAESHSSRGHGVGSQEFVLWLRTLIEVARETDPSFDAEAEASWRACLEPCIATVVSHAGRAS